MEDTASKFVRIVCGVGTKPVTIDWQEGMTVARALGKAEVAIPEGHTATLGRRRIQNPEAEAVQPYDIIIIAGKPGNG